MTHDRDPDIRDFAYRALESIDPKLLDPLVKTFRRRLASSDPDEVVRSAWFLAERRDIRSVPRIEGFRDQWEPWEAFYKIAEVILLVLTDPDAIARRIRSHDHDRMWWLATAASKIDDPDAIAALRDCSASAPDEDCRKACAWGLTRVSSN